MSESETLFTGRLKRAIESQEQEGRRRGLRLFQRKLEERSEELAASGRDELVGTALSSVQKYVSGDREPTRRWIVEAAEVLGVRPAWLLVGDGPMRPTETDADDAAVEATRAVQGRRWREEHRGIVESTLGARVPALARAAIAHEWRRLSVLASQSPATREDPAELLRKLCEAVAAPAEALGVDLSELRENDVTDYVMDVVRPVAAAWKVRLREQVSDWIEEESETQEG